MRAHAPLWFFFEEGANELVQKFLDRNEDPPLFYEPIPLLTDVPRCESWQSRQTR
jgi:hypothetical protein